MTKDISEHAVTIKRLYGTAWEAFVNGDKVKAYRLYREIEMAARAAGDACQPAPAKDDDGPMVYAHAWPYRGVK